MIKVNELRIGNLVKYTGAPYPSYPLQDGIVTVEQVLADGVNLSQGDLTMYESALLEGIPLTPEWLERCGFTYGSTMERGESEETVAWGIQISNSNYLEYQIVNGVSAQTKESRSWPEWRIVGEFCMNRLDFWNDIVHIHQLQNLYFALTGEELQIKL